MDQAIMGQWSSTSQRRLKSAARQTHSALPEPPDSPTKTIRQLRREQQRLAQSQRHQAIADFQAGQSLEASGKPTTAKIYYRMALRRATGRLRDLISTQLETISTPKVARSK